MLASNKEVTPTHYVVFFLWIALTILMARYFIAERLVEFDPEKKLTAISSIAIIEQLNKIEGLKNRSLSNTIIHFTTDGCMCTQYSDAHKQAINQQATRDGFNVININLSKDYLPLIPSTPAILIISEAHELLYLGPYSVGLACSQSNGYVEIVLNNYSKGYSSNLIINDAEGCYCNI